MLIWKKRRWCWFVPLGFVTEDKLQSVSNLEEEKDGNQKQIESDQEYPCMHLHLSIRLHTETYSTAYHLPPTHLTAYLTYSVQIRDTTCSSSTFLDRLLYTPWKYPPSCRSSLPAVFSALVHIKALIRNYLAVTIHVTHF